MNFILIFGCLLLWTVSASDYLCPRGVDGKPPPLDPEVMGKLIETLRKNALVKQEKLKHDIGRLQEKITMLNQMLKQSEALKKENIQLKKQVEDLTLPVGEKGNSVDVWQAASDGDLPAVQFYINQDRSNLNKHKENENNNTPLIFAAFKGHLNVVEFLVQTGADINGMDADNNTALNFASGWGHTSIVKFLIEKGADINRQGKYKWTALHYATWGNHLDSVKLLINNGADKNIKDNGGTTPLDSAKIHGFNSIINFLSQI